MNTLNKVSFFCQKQFHRIFSFLVILNFIALYPDMRFYFGHSMLLSTWKVNPFYFVLNLISNQAGVTAELALIAIWFLSVSAFALLFFKRTVRSGAILSWIFLNLWLNSNNLSIDGSNCIMEVFLFLFCLSLLLKNELLFAKWGKIFLCLIYFNTGFSKLMSPDWRSGELLWNLIGAIQAGHNILNTNLLSLFFPVLLLCSWLVILSQLFSPLILIKSKLTPYFAIFEIIVHLGIIVLVKLYIFSGLMILLNLTLFIERPRSLEIARD